ncbi:MAG: FAD-dependent oxidoreductase [Actinomycetia bacterium]|nr:FAD-dependent oxidoreductase [Actinomycetes bacterium]
MSVSEDIWSPLDIGPVRVKHRLMMTAQTILYAEDHILGEKHLAFYEERARGGAALLITEQQAGHPLSKGSFHAGCTAHDKRAIAQYARLAEIVHPYGGRQFVQLFAAGVHDKGTMVHDNWHPLWAASRTPSVVHREVPMEMRQEHIDDIARAFGESALNVKVAGLDGVEIHGAHSYLVGQFLSRAYNRRTDGYGGSTRKRCQFAIDLGEHIRRQVGGDIAVGIRLSFDEFMGEGGITGEDTEETLDILAATGLFDFFNISGGGYHTLHYAVAPMNVEEGFMIPFGKQAKQIVGDRGKVFIVGRIVDPRMAEEIIGNSWADMVAMTRAQMADPQLVNKMRDGRVGDIVRCVGANECAARTFDQREVVCVMNPSVSREREWGEGTLRPIGPDEAKRVVVVGSGPAGMRLAGVAASRRHDVLLLDRETELGGHLNLLKRVPTRAAWQGAIDNLSRVLEREGVELRLGVEASRGLLEQEEPDAVVFATGATWDDTGFSPLRPERDTIPGFDSDQVLDVETATRRLLAESGSLGKRVIILDESGSYLPFGLAELLADEGADVELLSPNIVLGEELLRTFDAAHVLPRLRAKGVRLTAMQMIDSIDDGAVQIRDIWGFGDRTVEVDTVALATMRLPSEKLYLQSEGVFPEVHRVGDAVAPRRLVAIMYEAEKLGREI